MFLLVLFLVCLFVSTGVGVLSSLSDIRGMTIPNIYSGIVVLSFGIAFGALYLGGQTQVFAPLWSHLASAGIFFVVTFIMFATGALGAADSKLGAAYALWFGLSDMVVYLFFMALLGGLLGVVALVIGRYKPFKAAPEGSWIAQVQGGASKVPYGVAIASGTVIAFFHAGYLSPATFSSFIQGS